MLAGLFSMDSADQEPQNCIYQVEKLKEREKLEDDSKSRTGR